MTTLESDFEQELTDALLSDAADELYAEPNNLAFQFLETANQNFEDYADRNDYDIGGIPDSGRVTATSRGENSVSATVEWTHPLSALYEFGVSPHTITGDLAFPWEGPPEGTRPEGAPAFVQTDSVNWGSVTGGIPESRAIRNALQYWELIVGGEIQQ